MGRTLITLGVVLIVVGVLVTFGKLGRLPGDIHIEGKNGGGFYFPVVTCLVISVVVTLIGWVIAKFR